MIARSLCDAPEGPAHHGRLLRPRLLPPTPPDARRHVPARDRPRHRDLDPHLRRAPLAREPALRPVQPARRRVPAHDRLAPGLAAALHADLREQGRRHGLLEPAPALPGLDRVRAARGARDGAEADDEVPRRARREAPPGGLREAGDGDGGASGVAERGLPGRVSVVGCLAVRGAGAAEEARQGAGRSV